MNQSKRDAGFFPEARYAHHRRKFSYNIIPNHNQPCVILQIISPQISWFQATGICSSFSRVQNSVVDWRIIESRLEKERGSTIF